MDIFMDLFWFCESSATATSSLVFPDYNINIISKIEM